MTRAVRLELVVLSWLGDAPCGLTFGELRVRMGDAHGELGRTLERLAGQVKRYPGELYALTPFGRMRLKRDAALV